LAVGRESGVAGFGGNILLCDDLESDAETDAGHDDAWNYYLKQLLTRQDQGAAFIVLATRSAENDFVGRLLAAPDGKKWLHVRLPALAEKNDPLGRQPGEALAPNRYSREWLLEQRDAQGSIEFETRYQQHPVPLEGNWIKRAWFKERYTTLPEHFDRIVIGVDCASKPDVKKSDDHDWSAACVMGANGGNFYVLDVQRQKVTITGLYRFAREIAGKWPQYHGMYIEDASAGQQLLQVLKQETGVRCQAVPTAGGKLQRMRLALGPQEFGRVILPVTHPNLGAFERELFSFPQPGGHDDMADAYAIALTMLHQRAPQLGFVAGEFEAALLASRGETPHAGGTWHHRNWIAETEAERAGEFGDSIENYGFKHRII